MLDWDKVLDILGNVDNLGPLDRTVDFEALANSRVDPRVRGALINALLRLLGRGARFAWEHKHLVLRYGDEVLEVFDRIETVHELYAFLNRADVPVSARPPVIYDSASQMNWYLQSNGSYRPSGYIIFKR